MSFKKDESAVVKVKYVATYLYLDTNSDTFKQFNNLVGCTFKTAISDTYGQYNYLHQCIIGESAISKIQAEFVAWFSI